MNYDLTASLDIAEKATQIYLKYIEIYSKDWPVSEMDNAKETLGTLTIFCHQITNFIEKSKTGMDEESKKLLENYLPEVKSFCNQIIETLSPHVNLN